MNALEVFNKRLHVGTLSRDYGKTIDDVLHIEEPNEIDCIEQALTELERLQERDTAKKVIDDWICPNCDFHAFDGQHNFCPNCGQRLDWSISKC